MDENPYDPLYGLRENIEILVADIEKIGGRYILDPDVPNTQEARDRIEAGLFSLQRSQKKINGNHTKFIMPSSLEIEIGKQVPEPHLKLIVRDFPTFFVLEDNKYIRRIGGPVTGTYVIHPAVFADPHFKLTPGGRLIYTGSLFEEE